MNNTCLKIAAAMIASTGLFASSANASVTTYGCVEADTCTLQELFDDGYFEVDGLKFSNWELVSSTYTTPPGEPDPSLMDVEIYDSAYLEILGELPGNGPGIRIIDEMVIHGAELRDIRYKFEVSTPLGGNRVINSNALIIEGYSLTVGAVGQLEVNELVTNDQSLVLATKQLILELNGEPEPGFNPYYVFKEIAAQSTILVDTGFLEEGSPLNDESTLLGLSSYWQRFGYVDVITPVAIDIKPRKNPKNIIDLRKDKELKVAIAGSDTFLALQVDLETVEFGFGPSKASPINFKVQDYNRDGFSDLILIFNLSETGIVCNVTEATLTGETYAGDAIEGSDNFTVHPCP